MRDLVQKLVESTGPSGYESEVRAIIRSEIEPLAREVHVDNLGNLIASLGSQDPQARKIMLAAHMDEIGIIATHITEGGFVRFLPIGGVAPRNCPGSRVRFLNGSRGVIGVERLEDLHKQPSFEQMFLDVGVSRREDCPVQVGDMAIFERPLIELGTRWIAKAMDDRIGVAVLIETMRRLAENAGQLAHQFHFVFSVQEEVGLRGSTTAAFGVQPDLGLAVDVTVSGDTPKGLVMEVGLGQGPAIKVRDQGMLVDPRIVDWMVHTAQQAGLPYQLEVLERGTTDARAIQVAGAGVPAGCLSIPCRYIHSPSEMVDSNDVHHAVDLLVALLSGPLDLGDL